MYCILPIKTSTQFRDLSYAASSSQASHRLVTTTLSRFGPTRRRSLIALSASIIHPLPFFNSRLVTNPTLSPCPFLLGIDGGKPTRRTEGPGVSPLSRDGNQ